MIEQLGVYFIDKYNFPQLCDSAHNGDALSVDLLKVIADFVNQAPPAICALCARRVPIADVQDMVIVILRRPDSRALTSWICEDCGALDDLDREIEKVIRKWSDLPDGAVVEILGKRTLH